MIFYIFLISVLVLSSFFDLTNIKQRSKVIIVSVLSAILIIISGIRWETGTDWTPYLNFFESNYSFSEFISDEFEIGYALINYLSKSFIDSYNFLLLLLAVLVIAIKSKFVFAYSVYPLISYLFNFSSSLGELFIVRQYVAVAITMVSIRYIVDKNFIKYFLCILIAASFHLTALIFMPAYILYHQKFKRKHLVAIILVSILFGKMDIALPFLETSATYFSSEGTTALKLSNYLEKSALNENLDYGVMVLLGYIRRILFLPFLIGYLSPLQQRFKYYSGFLNLAVFGHCMYFFFIDNLSIFAIRASVYFVVYEIVLIPSLLLMIKKPAYKMLLWMVLVGYCVFKFSYSLLGYYDLYVPYITVFDSVHRSTY